MKAKPNRKTLRAAIRGSVPDGKLKGARIILKDVKGESNTIGFTEYSPNDKTVVKLGSPTTDDALGITVRGHETRHATRHKPSRKKPATQNEMIATQIVNDVNVETGQLPVISTGGMEMYRRAHIATAMHNVRTLCSDSKKPSTWALRNAMLLNALRAKAMLAHYRGAYNHYGDPLPTAKTIRQAVKGSKKIRMIVGEKTSKALNSIIRLARQQRGMARAISMLCALLEEEPAEDNDYPISESGNEGELLSPVTHGSALEGRMQIRKLLPMSTFTTKEKRVSRKTAPDGVILNPARFVNAIASNDANGLFARRIRYKAGGTIVIDASGSMGATTENLAELCKLCPTATVAYYSGNERASGILTVFALNGRRFDGVLPEDTLRGGNAVDLAAVQWLLRQSKPHTLVSDLQFCGGMLGSETLAHALVERGVKRGDLTVYHSLDAAYEAFGGKGDLSDMAHKAWKRENEIALTVARLKKERERKAAEKLAKSASEAFGS